VKLFSSRLGYVCGVVMYTTFADSPSDQSRWMTHTKIYVFKVFSTMQDICSGFFALQDVEIVSTHKYME